MPSSRRRRIRQLEDDIVEVGGDIAGTPHGCLIGLEGGDDLLEEYRGLVRTLTAAQHKERRLVQEFADAQREVSDAMPWPEPGRQALRRVFRTAPPGLVVHTNDDGWGIYLGHGGQGGVGRFLFAESIRLLTQYRQIDYLPDDKVVTLPTELIEPPDGTIDATALVSVAELRGIAKQLQDLDLPDLAQMAVEFRDHEMGRMTASLDAVRSDVADAEEQVSILLGSRDAHPCHACPRRKEHRDFLARIDNLEQERNALEAVLQRESEAEEVRIRAVIRGIRDVLHRFGYLHRGYPTNKADMLADVFDNDGLILCELVDRGWLDRLPAEDIAEVFSWFCYDREFRYTNHFTLPDTLVLLRRRLEELERDVIEEERDHGLVISEGHNQAFYGAVRAWCRGATMVQIGEAIELSEGDLVLTINKTIDLMRQVREMLADVMPDHPLRATLREAERLVRRGIVEQSLSMGFAPVDLSALDLAVEVAEAPADVPLEPNGALKDEPIPDPAPAAVTPKKRASGSRKKPEVDPTVA